MPLTIVRDDITRMKVDAIVNSTNEYLQPGGLGVDASIHAAAGPELEKALAGIGFCHTGSAVITESFGIQTCKFIIHAVGPRYEDGKHDEPELLRSCYRSILRQAWGHGCRSLAIPSISSGAYGYPRAEAYHIATSSIRDFLFSLPEDDDMMVYLVLFDQESVQVGRHFESSIKENITEEYRESAKGKLGALRKGRSGRNNVRIGSLPQSISGTMPPMIASSFDYADAKLKEVTYTEQDLSFADMCEWWCGQKSLTKKEFYARANINKALFWNLKHHPEQMPKKTNALACAVGLRLSYDETQDLLMRAGLTLTKFYETDRIVEEHIRRGDYDIDTINIELFERDLALLGVF